MVQRSDRLGRVLARVERVLRVVRVLSDLLATRWN